MKNKQQKFIDIKFTHNQKLYFKQVLEDMYVTCNKDCYPMYFGFLEGCLEGIINGETKTLVIKATKKENSNGNT